MIYAALGFWIFAIIFAARGTLGVFSSLVGPKYLSWALLPGTLVSELEYYLACLLTGAEFHSKKLVEGDSAKPAGKAEPAKGGVPYLTPLLAGLLPLAASFALIYVICAPFGHQAYLWYRDVGVSAPNYLPGDGISFWAFVDAQVRLLEGGCRSLTQGLNAWPWQNWKGWLLEYLLVCLVLGMAPAKRPLRPALAGAAVLALITAGAAAVGSSKGKWQADYWPMLSYVWATALMLLGVALCIAAVVKLGNILLGKESAAPAKKPAK